MSHRPAVEPAAVLLAVERVGADVVALGRALAAQPEEVAARLDVDAATASIGVRIGALGSALDQLRLSLLAALDRAAEHADTPAWMPGLQATLAELAPRLDAPPWLPRLQAALAERDEAPPWLAEVQSRLTELSTRLDSPRWLRDLHAALAGLAPRLDAPPWLADLQMSLSDLAARLEAPPWLPALQNTLGDLQPLVAEQQRALRDAVTQLAVLELSLATAPGNEPVLNAIARLPGDDRLQELTSAIERRSGDRDVSERLVRVEAAIADLADGVRAGAAIADVLDHLGQRLASIEDAASRVATDAQTLVEQVAPVPDRLSAIAAQVDRITPLARAGDQAATLFDELDRVAVSLDEAINLLRPLADRHQDADGDADEEDLNERLEAVVDVLAGVTRRQDQVTDATDAVLERMAQQERSVSSHLDWVGERLAEVAAHLVPDEAAAAIDRDRLAGISETLAAVASRQELETTVTDTLRDDPGAQRLAEELASVARRQDELAAAVATLLDRLHGTGTVAEQIALVARRQEELAAALASSFDDARGPMAAAAVFDRMEQRERSLAARLDRIDAQLRQAAPARSGGDPRPEAEAEAQADRDAAVSLAASVEAVAAVTEKLAALVESSSERIDRRLSRVEQAMVDASRAALVAPATTPGSSSLDADVAALRLAELRAQRAEVQARLQEERLLAADIWDDDR